MAEHPSEKLRQRVAYVGPDGRVIPVAEWDGSRRRQSGSLFDGIPVTASSARSHTSRACSSVSPCRLIHRLPRPPHR